MSEMPPPERRPEPLGFDHAKNRINEQSRAEQMHQPVTGTLQPTRNLQTDLIGRTVGGRYIIKGVLGEGGMGTVYEAEHLGLGRARRDQGAEPVAGEEARRREALPAGSARCRRDRPPQHLRGLRPRSARRRQPLPRHGEARSARRSPIASHAKAACRSTSVVDIVIQVLSGLVAAHDKGIVHRDIKPENIFLARRVGCPPIVKLLDFGVSKMMPQFQGGDEQLDLTRTGMVMGTPYYMSPEQARGERNLDGRVDVYACGVMMYEALAGKRPFLAPNYNALLLAIINTTPKPIREIRPATPPALEAIVMHSMAKARDDRYPSANAVLARHPGARHRRARARDANAGPPTAAERMRAPVLGRTARIRAKRNRRAKKRRRAAREEAGATIADTDGRRGRDVAQPHGGGAAEPRRSHASRASEGTRRGSTSSPSTRTRRAAAQQAPRAVRGERLDRHSDPHHRLGSRARARRGSTAPPCRPRSAARASTSTTCRPRSSGPACTLSRDGPAEPVRDARAPAPRPARRRASSAGARIRLRRRRRWLPANLRGLVGDDWDGETVVKKPAALTTSRHRDRPNKTAARFTRSDPGSSGSSRSRRQRSRSIPTRR